MSLPSMSKIGRAIECPASEALPHAKDPVTPAATRGSAIHAYLAAVNPEDPASALAAVPEEFREDCASIELDRLPVGDSEWLREWAIACDVETGATREIGCDIGRDYGELAPTEIAGTIDVARVEDDRPGAPLTILDYKTGRTPVPTPSWQLRVFAAAAAVDAATVAHAFIREDGSVWIERAELDVFDLEDIRATLQALPARIAEARALVAAGTPPPVAEGDHCRYCPARRSCPAKVGLLVKVVREPLDLRDQITVLTDENAAEAVRVWDRARKTVADFGALVHAVARERPIDMGDGTWFGTVEKSRESIDGAIAQKTLTEAHGEKIAALGIQADPRATKKSLGEAARALVAEAKGRGEKATLKDTTAELLAAIRAADGIETKTSTRIDYFKAPAIEAGEETGNGE